LSNMAALFACGEAEVWRRVYEKYWDVVEATAKARKPKLLQLDKWYQEELPVLISSRPDKHITLSELKKLMEWKLTRGKFRPRLQQLAASNAEDAVQNRSRTALGLLPDVPAAVAELSGLKGVGPATASAVLAAAAPALTAFMSDEAAESVPGLQPVQYTAKHYALYLDKMAAQAAKLNAGEPDWTPHRLELCLWATATATKLQLPVLEDLKGGDTQTSGCDRRPAKKLKTA
uniref:Zgc:112496 n=1 Tax=Poecilia reticulata TaxID=8081 RepID=A0A3P9PXI3_POERE